MVQYLCSLSLGVTFHFISAQSNNMISLVYSEVPVYLHESEFYQALNPDDPHASFEVPTQCYRESDQNIDTVQDLENILCVMTFWGLKSFPISVLVFCSSHNFTFWESVVADEKNEFRILREIFDNRTIFTLQVALETEIVEFVTFWLNKSEPSDHGGEEAIAQACQFGRLDLVQTLHERGFPWDGDAYSSAAKFGHLEILKYLHKNGCVPYPNAIVSAIRNKQFDCAEYLISIGCPCELHTTQAAAEYGKLSILRRLHEELGCPWDTRATALAAGNGHLECLQYLHQNGCPWDVKATKLSAQYGEFHCLQYLHENGCPWDKEVTECASFNNDFDSLRYALENGCPFVDWRLLLKILSRADHLTCLQYLVEEQSSEMSEGLFAEAFIRGHVNQVRYLIDMGCPFQSYVFNKPDGLWYKVSDRAFLSCIQYAVDHGWQYNIDLVEFIESNSLPLCQAYIEEEGWRATLQGSINGTAPAARSCCALYNHLCQLPASDSHMFCFYCAVIESLCHYDSERFMLIAAGLNNVRAMKYLSNCGAPLTSFVLEAAVLRGNFRAVQYLVDNNCPVHEYIFQDPLASVEVPSDDNLLRCLILLFDRGWRGNTALLEYLVRNDMPLCLARVQDNMAIISYDDSSMLCD